MSAFAAYVVAAEAFLLCDSIAGLDLLILSMRSARGDRGEGGVFVAKFQAHDAPGNLWLIEVRENFETGGEAGVRDQIWANVEVVAFGVFGPRARRLPVDLEDEDGMMRGNVGVGVTREIFIVAYG